MKFKYVAMNARNQKKEGAIEAETQNQAVAILREKGLIVQDIQQAAGSDAPTSIWQMDMGGDIHNKSIKKKTLLMLFSQLGMMIAAVGAGEAIGIDAATAHAFTNILFKGVLMMGAGAVIYAT